MNIDRPNIDRTMMSLFFEIKRNMPLDQREKMKISSPLVGHQLVSVYRKSNDTALKHLIEKFMDGAGGEWTKRLVKSNKTNYLFKRASLISDKGFAN